MFWWGLVIVEYLHSFPRIWMDCCVGHPRTEVSTASSRRNIFRVEQPRTDKSDSSDVPSFPADTISR